MTPKKEHTKTLEDWLEAQRPLQRLGELELPGKVEYWLGRALDQLKSVLKPYYDEVNRVAKKYGAEKGSGQIKFPSDSARKTAERKLDEIKEIEESITFPVIRYEDVEGQEKVNSNFLGSLIWLIEPPKDEGEDE